MVAIDPTSGRLDIFQEHQNDTDWTQFEGHTVQVYDFGRLVGWGQVDAVTSDGSILWLAQNGVRNRWLVEKLPGRSLTVLLES
ncbi:hypothetical protein [Paenarthrobacter ureafaciens]|uniref:hypothetical protein n=1 Tax=Paenarthrobacter ureafaciens TaxID=37931 RepID=UPI002DB5E576|nr:hypothetical protein [Paenarthrobacter ureafaciens]MEC3853138.1 hypothetical protein [Paenarthrobacter ureafaciens]